MTVSKPHSTYVEQRDPPLPPSLTLPTMYDLPSEDPEEPGLPDEFHDLQPELLSTTLYLPSYRDNHFIGTDLNLYYDVHHPLWYKRPDWFLALGVPRLYNYQDMRLSYVVWQEGVNPLMAVELLSPGTDQEDLGKREPILGKPPTKWEVYEKILRIPYYVIFDRYSDEMRAFHLQGDRYESISLSEDKIWIPPLNLGLGSWYGAYRGIERLWLRWQAADGTWIETAEERAEAETQRAESELRRAEAETQRAEVELRRAEAAEAELAALKARLRAQGIDPNTI
jgi:Uma2 family endonuclease